MKSILPRIVPFIMLGIAIVAFVFGLILFSYLLIFGALVGLVLFAFTWIKEKFFPSKSISIQRPKSNRTFDHDEFP